MSGSGWSETMVATLTEAWMRGDSGTTIAGILGISKSAVVGKAHRIGLPGRESPIKKAGSAAESAQPKALPLAGKTTLPASAKSVVVAPPPVAAVPRPPVGGCRWPMWGNQAPTHVYCDAPRTSAANLYCCRHHEIAFSARKVGVTL